MAFYYCTGLQQITVPNGVAVLYRTFYGCTNLTDVLLPTSLSTIGENAFRDCTSLRQLTIPQSVSVVGASAFSGCSSLKSLALPTLLNSIGSCAFENCTALTEMTIPSTVAALPDYCFDGCTALQSVTLPVGLKTLSQYAFGNCRSLRTIDIPQGVTSIGDNCFRDCDGIRSMTLPSSVNYLGESPWRDCDAMSSITIKAAIPPSRQWNTFNYIPNPYTIYVPCDDMENYTDDSNWNTLPLAGIAESVLTVASSDEHLGEAIIVQANSCTDPTAIIQAIPHTGCQFVQWSDGNTENPRTLQVVSDITYTAQFSPIATYTLQVTYDTEAGYVDGAGNYFLGEEATLTAYPEPGYRFLQWGDGNTENPRTILMESDSTLTATFVRGEFCGDQILWTLEEGTLALNGQGEMYNQSEFGWHAFADEVETITLSHNITSIGTNAFMDLMFVPEITIPATVKTIHKRAFENCRSLADITFAANSQLTTIGAWAFFQCINLQTLTIPEGVTTIGNGAFYGCAYLKDLVLPSTLEDIDDNGFALCAQLRQMTVNAVEPPAVDSKTFENVSRAIPVHVPDGSGKKYRAAAVWQEFNIVDESDPTSMEQAEAALEAPRKVVRNGQVLIIRGDKTYDMMGQEVE